MEGREEKEEERKNARKIIRKLKRFPMILDIDDALRRVSGFAKPTRRKHVSLTTALTNSTVLASLFLCFYIYFFVALPCQYIETNKENRSLQSTKKKARYFMRLAPHPSHHDRLDETPLQVRSRNPFEKKLRNQMSLSTRLLLPTTVDWCIRRVCVRTSAYVR